MNPQQAFEEIQRLNQSFVNHYHEGQYHNALEAISNAIGKTLSLIDALSDNLPVALVNKLSGFISNRAVVLETIGQPEAAREEYDAAINIREQLLSDMGERWSADYLQDLASVYTNRANILSALGQPIAANQDYDHAIDLSEKIRQRLGDDWPTEYQNNLATVHSNRAVLRRALGRPDLAREDYSCAISIREDLRNTMGDDWPEQYRNNLATVYCNRANMLRADGEPQQAEADYNYAIELREALREDMQQEWLPEYQNDLATTYSNRANLIATLNNPRQSHSDYEQAVNLSHALREAMGQQWPPEYQNDLASAHSNRAGLFITLGDLDAATQDYDQAIAVREHLRNTMGEQWPLEYRNDLATVYSNRANLLLRLRKPYSAKADYDNAIELSEHLRETMGEQWAPEYRNDLATVYNNRANLLDAIGEADAARDDHDQAITLREYLRNMFGKQWPPEFRNDLATAYHNRSTFAWDNSPSDLSDAFSDQQAAEALMAELPKHLSLTYEDARFKVLTQGARLLGYRSDGASWALDTSRQLVDLLEAAPPVGTAAAAAWLPMYHQFQLFHLYWLKACLDEGRLTEIPAILSILQGRELASRQIEEAELLSEAKGIKTLPKAVRDYLAARTSLRNVREQLGQLLAQLEAYRHHAPETPDGRSGTAQTGVIDEAQIRLAIHHAEQQESAAREEVARTREIAARVDGYSALAAPYHPIDHEAIQSTLQDGEAMVILLQLPGSRRDRMDSYFALVCRADAEPLAVALGDLNAVTDAIAHFSGGQRGYRRDGSTDEHTNISAESFWDNTLNAQFKALWEPLNTSKALEDIEQIHLLPHGQLHLLPFGHQHPNSSAQLWRYPGLSFYLNLRKLTAKEPTKLSRIGVLAHPGDDHSIPLVKAEAATVSLIAGDRLEVIDPAIYPGTSEQAVDTAFAYDLLHLACHGYEIIDPASGGRLPTLHTAEGIQLTRYDLMSAANRAKHIYAGACVGARVREDMSGSPAGIVTAWFQAGTQSVCAALVSIPDQGAWLLGTLYHLALHEQSANPVNALHHAQQELAQAAQRHAQGQAPWDASMQTLLSQVLHKHLAAPLQALLISHSKRARAGFVSTNWLSKTVWPEQLQPWLEAQGVEREVIAQAAENMLQLDSDNLDALLQWLDGLVEEAVDKHAFTPPQQPHLGALLYGMAAFGIA